MNNKCTTTVSTPQADNYDYNSFLWHYDYNFASVVYIHLFVKKKRGNYVLKIILVGN